MGKSALITGASRGIGRAIAEALAGEGMDLYLLCHNNIEMLDELACRLTERYSISCHTFCGDVADSEFIDKVFSNIDSLDVLINNAGISHIGLLQDMTNEEWNKIINTNLSGVFYCCRAAIPLMLSSHSGRIINISSMWGSVGASMEVAYSTTKGGMNSFTKALAKELAPSNIIVNAIACGVIDTDMNSCFNDEEMSDLINDIPIGRLGKPSEVAQVVLELASAPEYMTGQIIGMDGGYI